jgi:hypothetical protein
MPNTSAPPSYPKLVSSAIQSPSAVPSVCENVIANGDEADQQQGRPARVTETQRTVREIGHSCAGCRRGNNGRPVEKGMKPIHCDLPHDERDQQRKENDRSDEVPPIQRRCDGIAEGLPKRRSCDLNDPENECDLGTLLPCCSAEPTIGTLLREMKGLRASECDSISA